MMRTDTLRLRIPDTAAGLNARQLVTHPETLNDRRRESARPRDLATLSGSEHLGFGFGRMQWDRLASVVSLDVSAKALGDLYPDGITARNLDALAAGLNRSGLVRLAPDALASAEVQWADVTVNLPVGDAALADDFDALRILRTNLRHKLTDQAPRGRSLTWKGSGKLKGHNLNAYDMGANLWSPKQRDFARTLSREAFKRCEGVARFERQARGPARVKHYLAHAVQGRPAMLAEVLSSDRAPVAELFDSVRGHTGQRELFSRSDDLAEAFGLPPGKQLVSSIYRRIGIESVCANLAWDFAAVRDWLRQYGGAKASELYDEARDLIEAHAAGPDGEKHARLFARLDALAAALRAAD